MTALRTIAAFWLLGAVPAERTAGDRSSAEGFASGSIPPATLDDTVRVNIYHVGEGNNSAKGANEAWWTPGAGVYHLGLEVYGWEVGFGFTAAPITGIYVVPPRKDPSHTFFKTVEIGKTKLVFGKYKQLLHDAMNNGDWLGSTYDLITKNCVIFVRYMLNECVGPKGEATLKSNAPEASRLMDIANMWGFDQERLESIGAFFAKSSQASAKSSKAASDAVGSAVQGVQQGISNAAARVGYAGVQPAYAPVNYHPKGQSLALADDVFLIRHQHAG